MFSFLQRPTPILPKGFIFETNKIPSPEDLNKLLARCKEATHSPKRLKLALDKSFCCLSILDAKKGVLTGFVRATTDNGLNANLWNLVAEPGSSQKRLLSFLINQMLLILKKELPGCSISVSSPISALEPLQSQGFLLDPNGIRAMAFRLR